MGHIYTVYHISTRQWNLLLPWTQLHSFHCVLYIAGSLTTAVRTRNTKREIHKETLIDCGFKCVVVLRTFPLYNGTLVLTLCWYWPEETSFWRELLLFGKEMYKFLRWAKALKCVGVYLLFKSIYINVIFLSSRYIISFQ